MTWGTFFEALEAYETGRYDGIGFVFCSADAYTGIDLDKCRDPQSEKIDPQVLEIINAFPGAYTEVSPSGTGVHIIIRGKLDADRNRHGNIEVYSQERYFTVSGVAL